MHSHSMHHVSDFPKKTQFVSQDFKGLRCRKRIMENMEKWRNAFLLLYISVMQLVFEAPCLLVHVELCATRMSVVPCSGLEILQQNHAKIFHHLPSLLQYGLPFVRSAKEVPWVCHHSRTHKLTVSKRCHGNDMKCMDIMSCEPTRFRKLMICNRLHVQPHH